MLLKKRNPLLVLALGLGLSVFAGCTDDEPVVDEAVQASEATDPAAIVEEDPSAAAFAAQAVYFDFDDSTVRADSQAALSALADHMRANAAVVVQIEGHCDERGSHEYNMALGERRANSVKNYLVQLGVDAGRLSTITYGEERPAVADGHDEAAWSRNRRAEFVISN
ncbi:MAG: peptidoglycan-associated lipoprotein Pal [Oligoflexales bacterium]|nr:peptidoglycan-associated lipoprotein Pal [Oligoflexales bacterium]